MVAAMGGTVGECDGRGQRTIALRAAGQPERSDGLPAGRAKQRDGIGRKRYSAGGTVSRQKKSDGVPYQAWQFPRPRFHHASPSDRE
ncbi:hypothetical protein NITLEN_10397 [Nitrospira lenta]|uniref:Uncharacterized protein n=1 Tax=Nitrospira lenta TaxID=1436998 RepID=A0A330L0J9_9BACT|nr:hypothetical protein NITLEN_10397 [Nitrospira lenta]